MGRMPVPARVSALPQKGCPPRGTCRITRRFHRLYGWQGWVAYALRTRPPLSGLPKEAFPLDLHVLGLPPAFVLSQDQTLRCTIDFPIFLSLFWAPLHLSVPYPPPLTPPGKRGGYCAGLKLSKNSLPRPLSVPLSLGESGCKSTTFYITRKHFFQLFFVKSRIHVIYNKKKFHINKIFP